MFLKKGQYEIIQTLTAGNFGQTYIAINKYSQPPNQEVVIKKLKPQQNDHIPCKMLNVYLKKKSRV